MSSIVFDMKKLAQQPLRSCYRCNFLLCLLILTQSGLVQASPLARIVVKDTNNYRLDERYQSMLLPYRIDTTELRSLRQYVGYKLKPGQQHELENQFSLAGWVHERWQHDPFERAPKQASSLDILHAAEQGQGFSCLEYSKVLRDVLTAYGFVSRIVDLQSSDIAYGGLGKAHVAVEAYSNQIAKWFFIDPQWGIYLQHNHQPISIYEYQQLRQHGMQYQVSIHPLHPGQAGELGSEDTQAYQQFINQYLGYLSVDQLIDKQQVNIILAMEGKSWPMTFQGLPRNNQIFTRKPQDIYFNLDQVNLVMHYQKDAQRLNHSQLEISSEQDYLTQMPSFAAVPDFEITPHHNMPWLSRFEYQLDHGKWQTLQTESFNWRLHVGENTLSVHAINSAGHAGPNTFINIEYTTKAD